MEKECECCGKLFEVVSGRGANNRVTCYECTSGEYKKTWRNKHLKRNYGLTLFNLKQMFEKQEGKCSICESDMKFENGNYNKGDKRNGREVCVDHDHSTGRVRGLLCFHCNTAIGHLFDNPKAVENIKNYLKQ